VIGSLVNWQAPWGGPVHWGVIIDVVADEAGGVLLSQHDTVRVRWFSEQMETEWWDVNQLAFVSHPVNDGGEGNVAEDIKRKS
jgi:hypothetical protein